VRRQQAENACFPAEIARKPLENFRQFDRVRGGIVAAVGFEKQGRGEVELRVQYVGSVGGDGRAGRRAAVEGEMHPEIPVLYPKPPLPGRSEGVHHVAQPVGELRPPQQAVFEVVQAEAFPPDFYPFFSKKTLSVF